MPGVGEVGELAGVNGTSNLGNNLALFCICILSQTMVFLLTFNNIPQNPVNSQGLIVTGLPVFLVVSLAYLGACQES